MKKTAKLIAVVAMFALVLSSLLITPASAAHAAEDWKFVTYPGKEKNVSNGFVEQTDRNGIRLSHEGHYPEDNVGLLYGKSLDINEGIQIDVTIEETDTGSPDMWYGVFIMNRPVYFNTGAKNEDDGFGIVLLTRTNMLQWFEVTGYGFTPSVQTNISTEQSEALFAPGANVVYDLKVEDEELHIYVNGEVVAQNDGSPFNFKKALPYLQDQCYVGFSMSETNGTTQSFVLNGINGEAAVTEGKILPQVIGGIEEAPIDFNAVNEFTLADFSDPAFLERMVNPKDCEIEMADDGGIKVTVTGPEPYFSIPMSRARWFDGLDFSLMKLTYKTAYAGDMEFRFTTEQVPSEDLCIVEYEFEAAAEYTEIVIDMDDDNNGNWSGSEVRSLAVRPMVEGVEGTEFYFKTMVLSKVVSEETEPPATEAPVTEAPKPADTEAKETEPAATQKPADGKDTEPSVIAPEPGSANLTWLWIVIGVVAAAAVVCVIIVLTKKKK